MAGRQPVENNQTIVQFGYLIVRTFEFLYDQFSTRVRSAIYAVPRVGLPSSMMDKRYRGIDRDALEAWSAEDLLLGFPNIPTPDPLVHDSCILLRSLEECGKSHDDFIFSRSDAEAVWSRIGGKDQWEVIWIQRVDGQAPPPVGATFLGFEPTWIEGDHFSPLCDSMCFPRWHGPDPEGELFSRHFGNLNQYALFQNADDARDFLSCYSSQTWTETGVFHIIEIWSVGLVDGDRVPRDSGG